MSTSKCNIRIIVNSYQTEFIKSSERETHFGLDVRKILDQTLPDDGPAASRDHRHPGDIHSPGAVRVGQMLGHVRFETFRDEVSRFAIGKTRETNTSRQRRSLTRYFHFFGVLNSILQTSFSTEQLLRKTRPKILTFHLLGNRYFYLYTSTNLRYLYFSPIF